MSNTLLSIGTQLQQIILPVIIIIGIIGNSLNIAVLTRRNLYHHSCSRYFLALASNNLFYSSFIMINGLLTSGYQINTTNYSTASCKIISFISTLSSFISPYLIVLASFDRCCSTSTNAQIRKLSCIRATYWMIIGIITFFSLFFIHIIVLVDLQPQRGFVCAIEASTTYSQVYIIVQVFLFAVIPPILMMLFGLITIQNSKNTGVTRVAVSRFNRTKNQLARMLLIQVTAHILLTLPSSTTYLISIIPNAIRTTIIFAFVATICQIFFYTSYVTPFFSYFLSGRIYREELFQLLKKIFPKCKTNQVKPSENQDTVLQTMPSARPPSNI